MGSARHRMGKRGMQLALSNDNQQQDAYSNCYCSLL